jgi:hypothetical protein
MTVPAVSPVRVVAVSNLAGAFEVQTDKPHGLSNGQLCTIGGCRNASGALVSGLNGTHSAILVDSTHFWFTSSYVSGYSFGGSVWGNGAKVTSSTLTAFDSNLAARVVDKTGDVLFGQYTASGSPGVAVATAGASILTTVAGAQVTTSGSAEFILGDNDDVQLLPARTRSIMVSALEAMNQYGDDGIVFGQQLTSAMGAASFTNGTTNTAIEKFWIPLSRLHDKATLLRATLLFFPSPFLATFTLPTVLPTFQLFRINPSTDVSLTSLAAVGAATFPTPSTAAAYAQAPAVGASGNFTLGTLNNGSAAINAGNQLEDAAGNLFRVTTSGTYQSGDPVPVQAIAPASPAVFYGANTNHSSGDTLSWVQAPANCQQGQTVATGGLTGGLNAGYAQTLVFTPDAGMGLIDQSTYVYLAVITDDNVATVNADYGMNTLYTAIKLDFGSITSLSPQ